MVIDFTQITTALISLLGVIITAFAIPRLRAIAADGSRPILCAAAKTAVYAAQQIFDAGDNGAKKSYALEYTKGVLARRHIKVSEEEVSAAIEAALKEIKMSVGEIW